MKYGKDPLCLFELNILEFLNIISITYILFRHKIGPIKKRILHLYLDIGSLYLNASNPYLYKHMLGMESTTFQVKIHPLTSSYKGETYDVYPLTQPNLPMHFGRNLNLI